VLVVSNDPVVLIRPEERVEGEPTSGMKGEQAVSIEGIWAGVAHTEAHIVSGWHHHGDFVSSIYVLSGTLRMESGPNGATVVEARPGDFLLVPKGAIHREGNPGDVESEIVVVRSGHGAAVVNVEGPARA
jgi:uncharacterized RmlC-like cupin family protein